MRIYNRAGDTNVVVDVMGYLVNGAAETTRAGRVVPLTAPFRAFDTRQAAFGTVPLGPGQAEDWSFAAFSDSVNIGGVPLGNQTALLGNLTNASLARQSRTVPVNSYLTVYPTPTNGVQAADDLQPQLGGGRRGARTWRWSRYSANADGARVQHQGLRALPARRLVPWSWATDRYGWLGRSG